MYTKGKNVKEIDLIYTGDQRPSTIPCPVKNQNFSKPEGGLWTSPMGDKGKSVWQEWCENEGYNTKYYKKNWHIVPHDDCKILVVETDLSNVSDYLIDCGGFNSKRLDFEKISLDYDAVYFPYDAVSLYNYRGCLRGYDVESCLFLKPKYDVMDDEEYRKFTRKKIEAERREIEEKLLYEMNNPRFAMKKMHEEALRREREENLKKQEEKVVVQEKDIEEKSEVTNENTKEISVEEKRKRAMLRRLAKLNVSSKNGVIKPKRTKLEKVYLVMMDKLKNR